MAAGQGGAPISLVALSWDAMKGALAAGGEDLDALTQESFRVLDAGTATITFATQTSEFRLPNVVGLLRGSDPDLRDEYVVFSAHMDHVGTGAPDSEGDSIFNGADDDASGTATVVEVAEAFSALTVAPRRSILFVAVSGEEKGLLGSDYFANHPPVGNDEIIANINLDMVSRNAPDTVSAIGQDYSSLGPSSRKSDVPSRTGALVAPHSGRKGPCWSQRPLQLREERRGCASFSRPAFTTSTTSSRTRSS